MPPKSYGLYYMFPTFVSKSLHAKKCFACYFLLPGYKYSGPKKNSLNIKFLGGIFLVHPGPRRRDIPDKNFMQVAFFCCFRQGVAGMSGDLGRDVPDLEKLYARKLWADFSHPKCNRITHSREKLFLHMPPLPMAQKHQLQ